MQDYLAAAGCCRPASACPSLQRGAPYFFVHEAWGVVAAGKESSRVANLMFCGYCFFPAGDPPVWTQKTRIEALEIGSGSRRG